MKKYYDDVNENDNLANSYEVEDKDSKFKRTVFIIIVLILLGTLLMSFGLFFLNRDAGGKKVSVGNSDLFIVHSKTNFGDQIPSFASYTSKENSFSYKFYVENDEKFDIGYSIVLHKNNNEDISGIEYVILQNNKELFKGVLQNSSDTTLVSTSINGDSLNNYEIKLWSSDPNKQLDFKVNVKTEEE